MVTHELVQAVEYKSGRTTYRNLPSTPDKINLLLDLTRTTGGHPEAEIVTLLIHEDGSVWPVDCDILGCYGPDIQPIADGELFACANCRSERNLT